MKDKNIQSAFYTYALTALIGLSFLSILFVFTWIDTRNTYENEFQFTANNISDVIASRIQAANDTLNNLVAFLDGNPRISSQQFQSLVSSITSSHEFMRGAVLVSRDMDQGGNTSNYTVNNIYLKDEDSSQITVQDIINNLVDAHIDNNSVNAVSSGIFSNDWQSFWLVQKTDRIDSNLGQQEIAAILVDSEKLASNVSDQIYLSFLLAGDLVSLSGRRVLHEADTVTEEFVIDTLANDLVTQFPYYSLRLSLSKGITWDDFDKVIFFIVFIIGAGVCLLLVALAKSRLDQENALRERNKIIEAKVNEQTIELENARDQALQASKTKSSFLASMSHEIRTPLNAIIGMSDLMVETDLNHEQKKYVSVFKKAGDTLLSLVNDILDLSKIEADQLQLEDIEFNLEETIEESVEIYALIAAEKNLELVCFFDPSINPARTGDPSRLRQVVLNLISNALKFTNEGEIYISVTQPSDAGPDNFNISVTDTGTGIPENKLEEIFESFSQADSSTTRKYGGTGLGLTISRRLIEMMGGRILVESEEGQGSVFCINLNLPIVENSSVQKQDPQLFAGHKMVIVDDNQHCRDVVDVYLSHLGLSVSTFSSAKSVNEYLNEHKNISFMVIDSEMPGLDGFELAKQINSSVNPVPMIMMLNPSMLNKNQKKLSELNMSSMYVTKPIKRKDLYNLIYKITNNTQNGEVKDTAQNNNDDIKPLKILLVDDNPDNRLLVKAYLKKLPYEIEEAENGEEALNMYIATNFDIVLMDVQMPVMDGRVATRKIREHEAQDNQNHTPVIALTAHAIKEEVDLCLEAGCDSHLSKPVKKSTLISTIQSLTA